MFLPPLACHWCKAELSVSQFPWQEGLCPLLPTVPVPGVLLHAAISPRALSLEKGGDGSGAVRSLAPWVSLLPELGHPAWAVTSQGSVWGQGVCRCVRAHMDVQFLYLLPAVAPVLLCQEADTPQAWECSGSVRPAALLGPFISDERTSVHGQARALTPTGTLVCTSSLAVLCLSFPWPLFSPWCS